MGAIVHTASGHILAEVAGDIAGIEVPEGCLLRDIIRPDSRYQYHYGEALAERTDITLSCDRGTIIADGNDAATVTGIPEGSWVLVNGELTEVEGEEVAIVAGATGARVVEMAGAWRSPPIIIRALPIEGLRELHWSRVKRARQAAETGGCETPLGRVDTDADSQRKISGAVQMAVIAQAAGIGFAQEWTMADDSNVEHDAPAMIAMGLAVGAHVSACHAHSQALRALIDAATAAVEIEAIDVTAGWPGT